MVDAVGRDAEVDGILGGRGHGLTVAVDGGQPCRDLCTRADIGDADDGERGRQSVTRSDQTIDGEVVAGMHPGEDFAMCHSELFRHRA